MGNAAKGEASVAVTNGKTYTLKFGVNVLAEAEEDASSPITLWEAAQRLNDGTIRFADLRWMMWVALRQHHPDLGLRDAGDVIDAVGYQEAMTAIMEALNAMMAQHPQKAAGSRRRGRKSGSTPSPKGSTQTGSGAAPLEN